MTEPTEPLKNCPFCGAGESQIHVNKGAWNGRGYGEPVSVEVRHWCADVPGQPSRMISRAGRDEASAIAAWNTRTTPQPTQSVLAQAAPQPAVQQGAGTRQEPVAWQSRTRPTWGSNTTPWYPWEICTKEQAEDYWKTPLLHGWAYEARALCIAPQAAPVAQGDALAYEQQVAIRQGHEIAASDSYFDARPQIDNNDRLKVFEAGFERGWDAARAQAKEG